MAIATSAPTRRVLLIDPDPVHRAVLSRWLREHDLDVMVAHDGANAVEIYQRSEIDAVIIDRDLPDYSAFELCREIHRAHPNGTLPILMSGTDVGEAEFERAFEVGVHDYLKKPLSPEEIFARLEHAMRGSELRKVLSDQNDVLSSELSEGQRALEAVNRQLKLQLLNQRALFDVSQQLNSSINIDEQINILLLTVMGQVGVEMAAIFTNDGDGENEEMRMCLHSAKGADPERIVAVRLHEERAYLDFIARNPRAIPLAELPPGLRQGPHLRRLMGLGYVSGCPIHMGAQLSGVLLLGPKMSGRPMTEHDFVLLASIAVSAGIAMEKADLFKKLQESYVATIQSLMSAMEAKDTYTRGHTARVSRYSLAIGKAMGFSREALDDLRFGSTLHDIGKIGINEAILNKPAGLTDDEFEVMREHPVLGDRILRKISFLQNARRMVRHHHERYDGRGYPDGLRGEDISLGARIVAVADAFDAMTSKRTYNDAMGLDEAIFNLTSKTHTQFCPDVVQIFVRLLQDDIVPRPSWMRD